MVHGTARSRWPYYLSPLLAAVLASGLVATRYVKGSLFFTPIPQPHSRPTPVVMVVLDELPLASLMDNRGGLDRRLFPNFASLTGDFDWFRNATAVAPFTFRALPAILTGRYHDPPTPRLHPQNLFALLADTHELAAVQQLSEFCPPERCASRSLVPLEARKLGAFASGKRGIMFRSFLHLLEPRERPCFCFLHLSMPHIPWIFVPSGMQYASPPDAPGEVDIPGPGRAWRQRHWLVAQAYQRHLLQVGLVDRLIEALIERLNDVGLYERSLIVITADHGVSFVPGAPRRRVERRTVPGVAPVPLFIKRPFQRHGRVIDRPVQTIDILPTVVDVLELSRTWSDLDGESVYAPRLERDHSRRLDRFELTSEGHEKYEAVARKYELFGRHGSLNLFAVAPAGLVGLLDERVGPTTPIEATSSPSPVTLFQDGHRLLPILRGRLAGVAQGASVLIAAAVNGRVIGITRSYDGVEGEYFYFMVPPHAVGAALRGLSLYQVDTRVASGERLVPLEVRVTDLID